MDIREVLKKHPKFYYFVADVFGPMMWTGYSPKKFLNKFCSGKDNILNLGSGPRILGQGVINIDQSKYKNVDLISDIKHIPMADNSANGIICDTVIEHVKEPDKVIKEMYRLLKPGTYAYITAPFLYPFHASPDDFIRWTKKGFERELSDFKIIKTGIRAGAFSTLNVYLCYFFALVFSFNSKKIFWLLVNLSIFIFFPIKLFDLIFSRLSMSENMASIMYYIVQKK